MNIQTGRDQKPSQSGLALAEQSQQDQPSARDISVSPTRGLTASSLRVPPATRQRVVTCHPPASLQPIGAFDFRFVASDCEVRHIVRSLAQDGQRDVVLISHPEDLSQDDLVHRLHISSDSRHSLKAGKLFENGEPVVLVLDIRNLTSAELPRFNDLLDPENPCLYDRVSGTRRSLGPHVSLQVLANPGQLMSVGSSETAPGADFWRRVNRPDNTWQFNSRAATEGLAEGGGSLLPDAAEAGDGDHVTLINCHLHGNWRQLLFGGPGMDDEGRIRHIPGQLESLQPGQQVILKGADWGDLSFEQTIRQLLARKQYRSNGETRELAEGIRWYRASVAEGELGKLFRSMAIVAPGGPQQTDPEIPVMVNQANINEWLNPIRISPEGFAVPNTSLEAQILAGGTVTVTSPLSEALWFRLLGVLQGIREKTGTVPPLRVVSVHKQPKSLGLDQSTGRQRNIFTLADNGLLNTVIYQQSAEASAWLDRQPEKPLVIQINEQTTLSQLFDNIHITSEQKARFGRRQSELQDALQSGRAVAFRGLESNPQLQQALEPLFCGQPLLVHGCLLAYPKARITLLWPQFEKSLSPVLNAALAVGEQCPGLDLWESAARNHGMARADLPEREISQLCEAFKTVPADLCEPLPQLTPGLLNNLILAAQQAQRWDNAGGLEPRHWRKAVDSVLTHGTRQVPSVRDFIKVASRQLFPDTGENVWVDPERLNSVISSARPLNRKYVEENVWQLARAVGAGVFRLAEGKPLQLSYENSKKQAVDVLSALIVAQAPKAQRDGIADRLAVASADSAKYSSLTVRSSARIKRLQDALGAGWQLRPQGSQSLSDAIHTLAAKCFHIARNESDGQEAERCHRITRELKQALVWQGDKEPPWSALAGDLYHGTIDQKDREARRLSRLHHRLTHSPVIFLQGETGTGKSYFSAAAASACGSASLVSLGPSDSEQTLMKRWQWQPYPDSDDRYMEQQNRVLMEWARTRPDDEGRYVTLILDEANLADTGLLASLNGLWAAEPCVYVSGHPVKVTPQHRVILTGNSDHYAGRQLDPTLKANTPRVYYPPLDRAFLQDRVIAPALTRQLQRHLPAKRAETLAHKAAQGVMALWQYYPELLPDREFTPRDLTDICAWVGWYLDQAQTTGITPDGVTLEQLNGLVLQGFCDVLNPQIPQSQQDAHAALELWFAARYPVDSILISQVLNRVLTDIQQAFTRTVATSKSGFDASGAAVVQLVQELGQDLSRCQQAYHHHKKHGGRQATIIEGPAGRGKDATLQLLINSWKEQVAARGEKMPPVYSLNACDCSWDTLRHTIQQAKMDGGIVIISEMNLIDSQHLEGELNDILAGDAHPGFHLFATTNPAGYSGRKSLTPALTGRLRHLLIREYNQNELQAIVGKVLPLTAQGKVLATQLSQWHCRLRRYLQQQNLPLQPTSADLQKVAMAITRRGDFSEQAVLASLSQHYRLYLMAAKTTLDQLPPLTEKIRASESIDRELCAWLNRVTQLERPWLICRGAFSSITEPCHEIRIQHHLDEAKAREDVVRLVAQTRWQASGLPVEPKASDDSLTRALYRHWQHRWFERCFHETGVSASSVFALTKEEQQTLGRSSTQRFLKAADRMITAWDSCEVHLWPAFWHQLKRLMNQPVNDFIDHALSDDKPGKNTSVTQSPKKHKLDCKTDYESQTLKHTGRIVFNSAHPPRMYRWWALDIRISDTGEIDRTVINGANYYGEEIIRPSRLPGREQKIELTRGQTLGTVRLSAGNGKYSLPSLTPHDRIVAMRTEPELEFQLIRDRYTGLHTASVPGVRSNQAVTFVYVIETTEPGEQSSHLTDSHGQAAVAQRFDAHCSQAMKAGIDKLFADLEQLPEETREPLRAIQQAEQPAQRAEAIARYCQQFSGSARPAKSKNFFEFLLRNRQGSCRHRTLVFVAFCRYYGIPSRVMKNELHGFVEYSLDGGGVWQTKDLGGALCEVNLKPADFQPSTQEHRSGSHAKQLTGSPANKSPVSIAEKMWMFLQGANAGHQQKTDRAADATGKAAGKSNGASVKANGSPANKSPVSIAAKMQMFLQGANAGHKQKTDRAADATGKRAGKSTGTGVKAKKRFGSMKISKLFGGVNGEQQQMKASTSGTRHDGACIVADTERALRKKGLTNVEMVNHLWKQKDLDFAGFSRGVALLKEKRVLTEDDLTMPFYRDVWEPDCAMIEAVDKMLTRGDVDGRSLLQQIGEFYSGIVMPEGLICNRFRLILQILINRKGNDYATFDFAREALAAGWLDPFRDGVDWSSDDGYHRCAYQHYKVLQRLQGVDELKSLAEHCLRQWYRNLLCQENNSEVWLQEYESIQNEDQFSFFVTNDHDGHSPYLESNIANSSLRSSWTDVPGNIPDIERMLAKKPSFPLFTAGKNKHRPLIIIGSIKWYETAIGAKMSTLRELRNRDISSQACQRAIEQAFCHYLYQLTHCKGGRLINCWVDASFGKYQFAAFSKASGQFGTHEPCSPKELFVMMSSIKQCHQFDESSLVTSYLKQALNAGNALVLKSDELTTIAREFVDSVDLDSLSTALDGQLTGTAYFNSDSEQSDFDESDFEESDFEQSDFD